MPKLIQRIRSNVTCRARIWVLPRYYRLVGKLPTHFLHIGKTGGTAIKNALQTASSTTIFHCHQITLRDIPIGDRVVFFVRDPISRFVSGFYSRQRQGQPRYNIPWSPEETLAFETFQSADELALAISSKNPEIREAAVQAMQTIGHVKTHYRDWLISRDYLLTRKSDVFFVGCQETLEQDFEILKRILRIPEASLPTDPTRSHRNPYGLNKQLGEKAIENLRNWYQEDYEMLEIILRLRNEIMDRGNSTVPSETGYPEL